MNHKDEAARLLDHALNKPSDTDGFFEVQAALAAAQIALVEAQEAANEQARIANLIALAGNNEAGRVADKAAGALTCCDGDNLRPEIAVALGIKGGNQ